MNYHELSNTALLCLLTSPEPSVQSFTMERWSDAIRQARRANLLARLAHVLRAHQLLDRVPEKARLHILAAQAIADSSCRSTLWEVRKIREALQPVGIPFVLLKGAAYALSSVSPSKGRIFADTDIMVPRDQLQKAERQLMAHGWMGTKLDKYDQKYYRTWMHELPPMQHLKRQTSIDVHHTILPPTASLKPNLEQLWQSAEQQGENTGVFVLSRYDMVLHSAVHLFHDGEFEQGLRDLVDMQALLNEYLDDSDFWDKLLARARVHNLSRPLYYALRNIAKIFGTVIPGNVLAQSQTDAKLSRLTVIIMDWLLANAMMPSVQSRTDVRISFAKWVLYVRSHFLRMPVYLLIPHLLKKSFSGHE